MKRTIGLRVDVDFAGGLKLGVPFLLELFRKNNIYATFYVTMGPDSFFKNTRRVSTKGYLKRFAALNPLKIALNFGPHYAASILSGRFNESVGADHPRLLKAIKQAGHEIGLHGYDHFWWAENIWDASEERVRMDMERAIGVFRHTAGFEPSAWASPNWRCSVSSIKFVDDHPFAYGADCRGTEAFFPKIDGYIGRKIQIPITLPCLHEIRNYMSSADPKHIMKEFISRLKNGLNVWCIHDYYEGVLERKLFSGLIERLKSDGWTFTPLIELVNSINPKTVPVVEIERRSLPGGRGNVSCQAAQV